MFLKIGFVGRRLPGLLVVLASLIGVATPTPAAAADPQFADLTYDVVYVRCPRGDEPVDRVGLEDLLNWNGVNDLWLSATNNVYQQPGCDLVVHRVGYAAGDPDAEEVLVDCDESDSSQAICSVADPNVSFDGQSIIYTKFIDTRSFATDNGLLGDGGLYYAEHHQSFMRLYPSGNGSGSFATMAATTLNPFDAPALVFRYDLDSGTETQVSPAPAFFAGRAHPGKDSEWTANNPVMDTGPFFMADGRIGMTSNRANGFQKFQLFAMSPDGRDLELLGHRAMSQQLHPATLADGRIMYSSFDVIGQKVENNQFSLFTIDPDGSFPFILSGKHDATGWVQHFATQLSDGDIVVSIYYNHNNGGMGSLMRFPIDPIGADFVHLNAPPSSSSAWDPGAPWAMGNTLIPFARPGQHLITPQSNWGDQQQALYSDSGDYWTHPADGHSVTQGGRFSHPSGAPDNDLLVTYTVGGSSSMPNTAFSSSLAETMELIGKDGGVWILDLTPNATDTVAHVGDDAMIVVDWPEYHEIMPRALVPFGDIHAAEAPELPERTPNNGVDPRLPAGEPFALSGASSLFDRETRALNGVPWNMQDGGGVMSGRTYLSLAASGSDLAIFDNEEIAGIRVLMPIVPFPNDYYGGAEKFSGMQRHPYRILGEFPVRKSGDPLDAQGNPDTSFAVRVPADTPFLFQTLDARGMGLDIETASRTMVRGEKQTCIGCHVHTREGMDFDDSLAAASDHPFGDFVGPKTPLFSDNGGSGEPLVEYAQDLYAGLPAAQARQSFALEWDTEIGPVFAQHCSSCHGEGQSAQEATGLRLDGTAETYDLLTTNQYNGPGGTVNANTNPGDGLSDLDAPGTDRITPRYQCCTDSRWLSYNSARSSMIAWALYGERLDGRDPTTGLPPANVPIDGNSLEHPEIWPKVGEHDDYLTNMSEADKRLITRWIDLGAPKTNTHDDMTRPVLTLTPVLEDETLTHVQIGLWDDSGLDYGRFAVTDDGMDVTPAIAGTPSMVELTLSPAVNLGDSDERELVFEIWDSPDRTWSLVQPGVPAANRTRRVVSAQGLLGLALNQGDGESGGDETGNTDETGPADETGSTGDGESEVSSSSNGSGSAEGESDTDGSTDESSGNSPNASGGSGGCGCTANSGHSWELGLWMWVLILRRRRD